MEQFFLDRFRSREWGKKKPKLLPINVASLERTNEFQKENTEQQQGKSPPFFVFVFGARARKSSGSSKHMRKKSPRFLCCLCLVEGRNNKSVPLRPSVGSLSPSGTVYGA